MGTAADAFPRYQRNFLEIGERLREFPGELSVHSRLIWGEGWGVGRADDGGRVSYMARKR